MVEDESQRLISKKHNLETRARIYEFTRTFFREEGFLEIETPIRLPAVAPEQYIVPFDSEGWFLVTSPELHMKRLLAAGYKRIFQICRCFRKDECGRYHNSEFTMLEWYRIGADYMQMVCDTEKLLITLNQKLWHSPSILYQNQKIDITPPWHRITVRDAFLQAAGWDPITEFDPARFDEDMVTKVIPSFAPGRPTVLMDYPAPAASLARLKPGETGVAERAEIFLGGLELANAYSELREQEEQQKRFQIEIENIQQAQKRKVTMPWQFIKSIAHLPECGGIALGIDRLVMLLCDARSIDEVLAFTVDTI